MTLGPYISVPFCRTKCSYCNFASDVFSRSVFTGYVDRVCADIEQAAETAQQMRGQFETLVDSIYLGGGTPTILDSHQLERLFVTISQNFCLQPRAEVTLECAPGTLTPPLVETFVRCGVNRVSLGVQSFVDREAEAVARLHKRATVLDDLVKLRAAGIFNINIDLIAGLPYQTTPSWEFSLSEAIASGVPHLSVYILEVDEDSRLGRELIAGGTRYHAHWVPDEDLTADLYWAACERLEGAGVKQYEISNFAREGHESHHNLKYWTRQPYLGFGVDAHSMLPATAKPGPGRKLRGSASDDLGSFEGRASDAESVRFSTPESLDQYVSGGPWKQTIVSRRGALEETFFLGLRLTRGVDLSAVEAEFGGDAVPLFLPAIEDLINAELLRRVGNSICLTPRGRLLSNEVFQRFISVPAKTI